MQRVSAQKGLKIVWSADSWYLEYRPSSLATAAVLVVLNRLFDARTQFPSLGDALQDLYTPPHIAEVGPLATLYLGF